MFNQFMGRTILLTLLVLMPGSVFAESVMPMLGYTGAPADHGGQNCSACHTGSGNVNPSSGTLIVNVNPTYIPDQPQTIQIMVNDSQAVTWGFQMTIREVSNQTLSYGAFSSPSSNAQVVCDDGSQYGSAPPCTTARQFAEQKGPLRTATGAGMSFSVQWTPAEQEVGNVQVYVAAVAGNGDGTDQGDHVYTQVVTIANGGACSLSMEPTLQTVVNAASFQPAISSNSLITLFGSPFQMSGETRTAGLGDFVNGGFPDTLSCVEVYVSGPGIPTAVAIPLIYVSDGQINAQLPEFSGTGPVSFSVILNAGKPNQLQASPLATFNSLQAFAPAFFVFPGSTSIAAQNAVTFSIVARPSVVSGASPANPGDLVTLYGTGFGDTNPPVSYGQLASGITPLVNQISVNIGGIALPQSAILYAGLSPGSISGLYQINVQIPTSAPSGDVPVTVTIGGFQTQAGATIPIQ